MVIGEKIPMAIKIREFFQKSPHPIVKYDLCKIFYTYELLFCHTPNSSRTQLNLNLT